MTKAVRLLRGGPGQLLLAAGMMNMHGVLRQRPGTFRVCGYILHLQDHLPSLTGGLPLRDV